MRNLLKIVLVLGSLLTLMFALQRYASCRYFTAALDNKALCYLSTGHSQFLEGGVEFDGEEGESVSFTTIPLILPPRSFLYKEGESAQEQRTASRFFGQSDSGLVNPTHRNQTVCGHTRFDSIGPREVRRKLIPTSDYAPTLYLTVTHWGTRERVALALVDRAGDLRDANVRARRERLLSAQNIDMASLNLHLNEWWAHDRAWIRRGGWIAYAIITAIAFWFLYRNMILRAARASGRRATAGGKQISSVAEAVLATTKRGYEAASRTIDNTVDRMNCPPDQ